MNFDKQKKQVLSRLDKSKKGSIDKQIMPLVKSINSLQDYYTSSSCLGRIFLIEISKTRRKDKSNWLLVKHSKVNLKEIKDSLKKISQKPVWFKQEPLILHICCKNIETANKMLKTCREAGLKRVGIITISKRIIIEVIGTEFLHTLIAEKGHILIDDNYLEILIREANKKHTKNLERIKQLENKIRELKN